MLRPLPNWFHGLLPESLWPDRPREFYAYTLNLIPLAASATITTDVVFSKKTDSLIFGGTAIRTTPDGITLFNPLAGSAVRALIQLSNSAAAELYTEVQVPFENLFSSWGPRMGPAGFVNAGAKLPAYWPQPIFVRRGGALSMLITDQANTASHWRFTFWGCLLYEQSERVVAA